MLFSPCPAPAIEQSRVRLCVILPAIGGLIAGSSLLGLRVDRFDDSEICRVCPHRMHVLIQWLIQFLQIVAERESMYSS